MNVAELLDDLVPRDDRPGDWDDVLRRARAPRRRIAVAVALVAAALLAAPALAVLLTRDRGPQLPAAADRSQTAVVLDPATGKLIAKVAPWRGHDGVCFAALVGRSGCVSRGTAFVSLAAGYTFDRRVVAGSAIRPRSGKRVTLTLRRFPKLGVTFFSTSEGALRLLWRVELRDAGGRVLHTLTNRPRR